MNGDLREARIQVDNQIFICQEERDPNLWPPWPADSRSLWRDQNGEVVPFLMEQFPAQPFGPALPTPEHHAAFLAVEYYRSLGKDAEVLDHVEPEAVFDEFTIF